jgi:tetratricopeptide (TPR) repeat protein
MASRDGSTARHDGATEPFHLGNALSRQGRFVEAAAAYRRALELRPDHAQTYNNLGAALLEVGALGAAAAAYRHAIALKPDHAKAHYNLGLVLQIQGDLDEAAQRFRQAIALKPDYAKAHYSLANQRALDDRSPAAETDFISLSAQVDALDGSESEAAELLLFAMARTLEGRGDYEGAFSCLRRANALRRAASGFDIAAAERRMGSIAEQFSDDLMARMAGAGVSSDRPVLIVGMPRSGTTLVEQILSAHPAVYGAGEIANLANLIAQVGGPDGSAYPLWAKVLTASDFGVLGQLYLDGLPTPAAGQVRTTDKRVANFEHLGLIHLCLPGARIIHCRRDPRDVALSCFASRFSDGQDFADDLVELGRYWRAYDRLMAHWRRILPPGRMLEVDYEAVVEDTESLARRLIDHCGLAWNAACLQFHASGREVRTGSFAQVRRPIYTGSVGRWRPFAAQLEPFIEVIEAA